MFRHTALFRWTTDTTADQIATVTATLRALPAAIPELVRYHCGPDLGLSEGNFDYAVVADLASEADYVTYRDHPAHVAALAEQVRPHLAERAAVQYELVES